MKKGILATTVFCILMGAQGIAHADPGYQLIDHGDGALGPNYGLRVDNSSGGQTFSFAPGVFLTFNFPAGTGRIFGTVEHNQGASNQLWDIEVDLSVHLFTQADASDWRSNTSGDLYNGMIEDLSNATNTDAQGHSGMDLKDAATLADRLGFDIVNLTMTLQAGQGAPEYTLGSQTGGVINLIQYPNSVGTIPFMFVRGHRDGAASSRVAGFGWLDEDGLPPRTLTQDFLFIVGDRQHVGEPTAIALFGLAAGFVLLRGRLARRRAAKRYKQTPG